MRTLLLILFIGQFFISSAQDVMVIERSYKTDILFDSLNPKSLVQILIQNLGYLDDLEFFGISETDLHKLTVEQKVDLITFIGQPGTTLLTQDDPSHPNFGDPLVVLDANGFQAYVYDAPDTTYTDLTDLSHIVLDLKAEGANLIERTTAVTFCKSYNGETIRVLRHEGNALLKLDGFKLLSAVNQESQEKLLADNEDSYWNQLRDSTNHNGRGGFDELHFFPKWFEFGLVDWARLEIFNFSPNSESKFSFENPVLISGCPFGFWFVELLKKDASYLQELQRRFDSVTYSMYQSELPLIDEEPNSPYFGELLIVTGPDGRQELVYPDPEVIVEWLDYSPKFYKIERLKSSDEGFDSELIQLLAVKVEGGEEFLVSFHKIGAGWSELFKDANILDFNWAEWQLNFRSALEQGKRYDLSKKNCRKKLNFSDAFWTFYEWEGLD